LTVKKNRRQRFYRFRESKESWPRGPGFGYPQRVFGLLKIHRLIEIPIIKQGKDERRTSNIQRSTSNMDVAALFFLLNRNAEGVP